MGGERGGREGRKGEKGERRKREKGRGDGRGGEGRGGEGREVTCTDIVPSLSVQLAILNRAKYSDQLHRSVQSH